MGNSHCLIMAYIMVLLLPRQGLLCRQTTTLSNCKSQISGLKKKPLYMLLCRSMMTTSKENRWRRGAGGSSFRLVVICLALSGVGTFTLYYVSGDSLTHTDHKLRLELILIRILKWFDPYGNVCGSLGVSVCFHTCDLINPTYCTFPS